jgi:hypothetical protein
MFALYVLAWFGVVVPGHTRGMLTMPGGAGDSPSVRGSCCAASPEPEQPCKPTRDQQRRCAVCYVAANYTVPVVHAFDLDPADWVAITNVAAQAQLESLDFPAPYWPVGPPACM